MKRNQAIDKVVSELKVIKEELMGGKTINPLRFLTLSEIFKFIKNITNSFISFHNPFINKYLNQSNSIYN